MRTQHPSNVRHDPEGTRPPPGSRLKILALLVGVFGPTSVGAAPERRAVDLELILAVDVSPSMSQAEQRVQRDGYVSAFQHSDVARAIATGARGRIAVAYVEWAGPKYQRVVVPWTIIGSYDDAKRFADALAVRPIVREAGTSISRGLQAAEDLFAHNWALGERRVVDVSGDGPNNAGPPVAPVRDELIASGITINGLPVSLPHGTSNGFESYGGGYLNAYYEHCVIGGPDAFVIGVDDLALFAVAIRRKLVREIADISSRPRLASYVPSRRSAFDCSTSGEAPHP
ncbi:DUF1194 domain-containing protein [Mesorhizobium sp. GbtcB19]|uniref:DUF1194 domain-containing protein n=1 Tax=Mesorhizobium sp. GbtcB19 TaxID=2824764 RepID=UPI001C2F8CBE|nr:DUF1194 domain-containing protein [Mesorhizobium sp. GbtcB19]